VLTGVLPLLLAFQSSQPSVILKTETRAVEVNVVVEDHRANPIRDLRKEDFKLFDNGKPREIQIFSMDSAEITSRAPTRHTVVILDRINTDFKYQKFMLDQAIKSVAWMPLDESIAVLRLVAGMPYLPFNQNRVAQIAAIKNFEPKPGEYSMGERVAVTEVAMIRLSGLMRNFPGRKSIIWVSEGLPNDPGFEPAYQHIIDTLNDANIGLYPIDAGALAPDIQMLKNTLMQRFADSTGGLAFYNRSDLKNLMDAAFEDTRFSYVLGFYLTDAERDWNEHKLKVQVSRGHPVVRYRHTYSPAAAPQD
jgi:VWFA-related protein